MPSRRFFSRLHWLIVEVVMLALALIGAFKLISEELRSLF
jgi:hypothetical protein